MTGRQFLSEGWTPATATDAGDVARVMVQPGVDAFLDRDLNTGLQIGPQRAIIGDGTNLDDALTALRSQRDTVLQLTPGNLIDVNSRYTMADGRTEWTVTHAPTGITGTGTGATAMEAWFAAVRQIRDAVYARYMEERDGD